jgi:hypothetical protein
MSDDIVVRLRHYDWLRDGEYPEVWMIEAADEIERLRELVKSKDILISQLRDELKAHDGDR